jgi:hypothetical protein
LEEWENVLNDTTILDKMSADSCEKLKNEIFRSIRARLGLE